MPVGEMARHVHGWKGRVSINTGTTYIAALFGLDDCFDLISQSKGIQYTGNDEKHNNISPYYASYLWLRTK